LRFALGGDTLLQNVEGESLMPVRRFIPALLLAVLCQPLVPVAETLPGPGTPTSAATPVRLVSTDAAVTEILVSLGVSDRLVAVDNSSALPAARSLPRLGYHRALSAEGLIGLAPDLVIGSEHMGPPHVLDTLERADIEVLKLSSPKSLEQLEANIGAVATAVGSDRGTVMRAELGTAARQLQSLALSGRRVAFLLRGEGGKLRLAGRNTGGAGFIELLGGANVADYVAYRSITPEALLQLAPDILLVAETVAGDPVSLVEQYPILRFSPAVGEQQVYRVEASSLVAGISMSALREAERILRQANQAWAQR